MLVEVMKIEMFVNMLLPVKRCRQAGNRSQFIGTAERPLTFFEIFDSDPLNKKRVPLALTSPIMRMAMKCRHNATETKGNRFIPKRTVSECRHESAHYVISKADVRPKVLEQPVDNRKGILHSTEYL